MAIAETVKFNAARLERRVFRLEPRKAEERSRELGDEAIDLNDPSDAPWERLRTFWSGRLKAKAGRSAHRAMEQDDG